MDKLVTLNLFTRIVELKSFSLAADQLAIPRATASHAIKQLESSLNTRLLERTTRHVRTTLDGQAYYRRCKSILSELEDADSALRDIHAKPKGILRVDLHGTHATKIVLPRIADFHQNYPDIQLIMSSGDRLVDLVKEGIDCVVRAGTLQDSSLIARPLMKMPQVICASPAYLAQYGYPQTPNDLKLHHCVGFFSSSRQHSYPFELIVDGNTVQYQLQHWLSVNDAENYVISALQGTGLIQVPRYHVEDAIQNNLLVELLKDWQSPYMNVAALYPQHKQLSPRVRVFIDWLVTLYQQL
ncbi:LysR family transcriptional regulator [Acinetobacter wuhouensis]|uniref:LysR family transcriptional regulator n=1 Tax=Acinetobacter wuhouensis TaxID=1879050 RepID=UPI001022EBD2|nr:LysR family transcriptional regulator [Acinetobacter wuhouensis]RZG75514.1 LysR family transcriptional regulator [Acinetobacter wuhouensis]